MPAIILEKPQTIAEVQARLRALDQKLPQNPGLALFNRVYQIITAGLATNLEKFDDQDREERLSVEFAELYFRALATYMEIPIYDLRSTIPGSADPAWQILFDNPKIRPLVGLAMAVNAHINNDLPQALLSTEPSKPDYDLNGQVIEGSMTEIAALIQPHTNWLPGSMVKFGMKRIVRRWRARAWRNYQKLKAGTLTPDKLQSQAVRTARLVIRLA